MEHILARPALPDHVEDSGHWWRRHQTLRSALELPIERAIVGGFRADRPAYAFAAGYQEALRELLGVQGSALDDERLALTATEREGNHPAAIRSSLRPQEDGFVLTGEKTWATEANRLVVIASTGSDPDGRNRLAAILVPTERVGVSTRPHDNPSPLVPEIPHLMVRFDGVTVDPHDVLPGDGYERYLRPFRSIEDLHVHAALLAWLFRIGRSSGWSSDLCERLLNTLLAATSLGSLDPSSPATHVALAGFLGQGRLLVEEAEAQPSWVDEASRRRWLRDRRLMSIASSARERRRENAWRKLASSSPAP